MGTKSQAAWNAEAARGDREKLEQLAVRTAKALAATDGPQYTAEFREARRREIHALAGAEAGTLLARLRERVVVATQTREQTGAGYHRMQATIAKPLEAAALRQRFDAVPLGGLVSLAREAVARKDYLVADAILTSRSVTTADQAVPEVVQLVTSLHETFEAMDPESREPVELLAREVGHHLVSGEILAAEVSGRPLTSVAKLSLAHSHETAAVVAAA